VRPEVQFQKLIQSRPRNCLIIDVVNSSHAEDGLLAKSENNQQHVLLRTALCRPKLERSFGMVPGMFAQYDASAEYFAFGV
jgi:hypothetical protein